MDQPFKFFKILKHWPGFCFFGYLISLGLLHGFDLMSLLPDAAFERTFILLFIYFASFGGLAIAGLPVLLGAVFMVSLVSIYYLFLKKFLPSHKLTGAVTRASLIAIPISGMIALSVQILRG